MTRLVKIPDMVKTPVPIKEPVFPPNNFNVQSNRITSREETYLRIQGAFKIKVQNKGDVDVVIFGNYPLPSYSEEVFENGDTLLGFSADTAIEYAPEAVGENINLILTTYTRNK